MTRPIWVVLTLHDTALLECLLCCFTVVSSTIPHMHDDPIRSYECHMFFCTECHIWCHHITLALCVFIVRQYLHPAAFKGEIDKMETVHITSYYIII